ADPSGNWTFTPSSPLADGTVVSAVASDAAGNPSPSSSVTVDALAPAVPTINLSNGSSLSGTAEIGSTVVISDASGNPIGEALVGPSGTWSYTPSPALANGTEVKVVAKDAAGNTSPEASVIVDSLPPAAPTINPSNGQTISGTGENGALITLTDSSGNPLGTVTVVGGVWSYDLTPDLANGTVVIAKASDATGNVSGPAAVTVDSIAPNAPVIAPSNGQIISGTAEPGATIILKDAGGTELGTVTADPSGNWTFTPSSPLADGTVVSAVASDAAGNPSPSSSVTVDALPPAAPLVNASNGSVLSGTAEGNATIDIYVGNTAIGQTTADAAGNWVFVPTTPLADDTVVEVTATDAAQNTSGPGVVTIDTDLPSTPLINPSNGVTITGSADPGVEVQLRDGSGALLGQVTVGGDGLWTFTPATPLADGAVVKAIAINAALTESGEASIVVDAVAPAAPIIAPSNGEQISGTAEAGATITLTDAGGTVLGEVTADPSGNWTFTPSSPLADSTVVNAVASDAAGNPSPSSSVTVDALPPGLPTIAPSNGVVVQGTAEANSTVLIRDGSGNPLGQANADGSGNWSFSPTPALLNGALISVVAQDAAGNTSAPATATVDALAPPTPVINLSNGEVISGTAEIGAKVLLTDGSGAVIGQATADGSGNWTFTPGTALANGVVINARAQDSAGNTSGPASTTVDALPPATPVVLPSNGSSLSGSAEAGAKLVIKDVVSGDVITELTVPVGGNWSYTPVPALANGTQVSVQAVDAAGNDSPTATVTVDSLPPAAPTVALSNGSSLSGTAEANSKVIITDGNGNPIGETTASPTGQWSFTPASVLAHASVVNVVARDASGNTGPAASVTIDSVAPPAPVLNPSNGQVLSGTAEANAQVTLTGSGGVPLGQVTAGPDGVWSLTLGTALADGTVVSATATDATGNTSGPAATTVDAQAPGTPIIALTNGSIVQGTAEIGAKVILTDGNGDPLAEVTADGAGNWSYTPSPALLNATVVNAKAVDAVGNSSGTATVTVDSLAPSAPVINPTKGAVLSGTGEIGAVIHLTDGSGAAIGQTTVAGDGTWSFTPTTALAHGTVVNATATDATGNLSDPASTSVDSVAPAAPGLSLNHDGNLLTGTAEANSQVRIVLNGDSANPIIVNVGGSGTFSLPISPALVAGEAIVGETIDASGNVSLPTTIHALDLAPPTLTVTEAADGYVNATEVSDGIQVQVGLRPTMQAGQVLTLKFAGQNGYEQDLSYTLTSSDIAAGSVNLTLSPQGGNGPFPEGASSITADISGGANGTPVNFVVDTIPPAQPVLTLVGNLLTVTSEPFTKVIVAVKVAGVEATVEVVTDASGKALVDLLTDLDVDFSWDQLLSAQVSARGEDLAGNQGGIASVGVGPSVPQPITVGNFGLDVALLPLPRLGISGVTTPGATVRVEIDTPALNVDLFPTVNSSGQFSVNLLDLLSISDVLNLGPNLSIMIVTTDSNGLDSSRYGIDLLPAGGGLLQLGTIHLYGTSGSDLLTATNGSAELIHGEEGHDLIRNVGTSDRVEAGDGNDTIQLTAVNFTSVDGGAGFDTLLLANGIDLDYNAIGVGTLSNIERINLGKGDSGSVLTLTAPEVGVITDSNNTLQITGESNDTLKVTGATDTNTTQVVGGVTYDVYSFGTNTLLVEENTVQVVLV
ncbi:Ig-like domain-containing protein, partial [Pseudomonas sp. 5P_3.1_Bac2]|uniref:Ig-like domain-containing protein n=1 Tax=Pseudomonas sp. 5P_3.1_Bac2 TaxID=2971617 RepID=UPI0021C63C3C